MHASSSAVSLRLGAAAAALALLTLAGASEARADLLGQFNIGVKGGLNLNLLSEPAEDQIDLPVPGFVGLAGGVGIVGEALALDIVGLEVGAIWVQTAGKGDIEFNSTSSVEQTLETSEWHFPLLLKAQVPAALVKPYIGLGITFVRQSEATYTVGEGVQVNTEAFDLTTNYSMWTLSLGAAIAPLPNLRIPIEVRALYQSLEDDPDVRARYTVQGNALTELGVLPTWEGQIWLMVGVLYGYGLTP